MVAVADHLRKLDVYDVVVPRRVDQRQSSPSVVGRRKRSSSDDDDNDDNDNDNRSSSPVYELTAFGRQMSLRLHASPTRLISPSFVVQHVADNETWLTTDDADSWPLARRRCFHEGHVDGHLHSIVVLSTCSHLVSKVLYKYA